MLPMDLRDLIGKYVQTDVIKELLYKRGLNNLKLINQYFAGNFCEITKYTQLYDLNAAVNRLIEARDKKEKVYVYGDYDADGICATAVLWEYLYEHLGLDVLPFIPSRIEHGYGLHDEAIKSLLDKGADLIITVDCGVRNVDVVHKWKLRGIDFIITDHHQPGDTLPDCVVVHPLYPGHEFPNSQASGTMVAWMLVLSLMYKINGCLLKKDFYEAGIDLVAISLITDMMNLQGDNRIIVKEGLKYLREYGGLGLHRLMDMANINYKKLNSQHIGFQLGPRLNAAGRIGKPLEAMRLLVSKDLSVVYKTALYLEHLNKERQQMTIELEEEVNQKINIFMQEKIIIAYGNNWHEGIIGLVAGKLQRQYGVPVAVITLTENKFRGSCRGVDGLNIIEILSMLKRYLSKFGGHIAAGGFSGKRNNFDSFKKGFYKYGNIAMKELDQTDKLCYETFLTVDQVSEKLWEDIQKLEPFGEGNKLPIFKFVGWQVREAYLMGSSKKHLTINLFSGQMHIKGIFFNGGHLLSQIKINQKIEFIGHLVMNEWQGNSTIQIHIKQILEA